MAPLIFTEVGKELLDFASGGGSGARELITTWDSLKQVFKKAKENRQACGGVTGSAGWFD